MKQTSNTKSAWIGAFAILVAAFIGGYFLLIDKKPENGKSINSTIIANDSSKVKVTNNQNDIKGDFVSGDKIIVNKEIHKERKSPKIDAPNALIVTQNQAGNNIVNVSQISDSYATNNDGSIIKEISYPSSGEYGINILDRTAFQYSVGTYSLNALIPKNQTVTVEISGVKWGFPAFQAMPGWKHFDTKTSGDTTSRKFKTVKFGNADLEFDLTGAGRIKISIYENDSKTPTWGKTIKVGSNMSNDTKAIH